MALQDIINTAVNIEVNRTKLIAQTVSRSGRISVASRNWANPFRFVITPKPVWTAAEYRSAFGALLDRDRYGSHAIVLNDVNRTTFIANLGNSWMVPYQGGNDLIGAYTKAYASGGAPGASTVTLANTTGLTVGMYIGGTGLTAPAKITLIVGSTVTIDSTFTIQAVGNYSIGSNNNLDSYQANTSTSGTKIVLTSVNTSNITAGTYIAKIGDYLRPSGNRYPYIATSDVIIPTAFTLKTGTIQPAGTTINTTENGISNLSYIATNTTTAITGIGSTTGLSVGQVITENGTNTGSFGGLTYIASIDSSSQISIVSTTACTSGSITFDGSGNTGTSCIAVPVHRGYIGSVGTNIEVRVGARAAAFNVIVTKLPQIRYLPGQLVELTSDIELIEEIL